MPFGMVIAYSPMSRLINEEFNMHIHRPAQSVTIPLSSIKKPVSVPNTPDSTSIAEMLNAVTAEAKPASVQAKIAMTDIPNKAEGLKADFQAWKTDYFKVGISADRRIEVEKNSSDFEKLMDKAAAQNAFDNPKKFLQTLAPTELATLQTIHGLAKPVNPDNISQEGALNLLLSPDKAQDTDHDGFQMVGLAKTWQFPPVNAPDSVKQAWKDTTANMNGHDKMMLQASFLPLFIEGVTTKSAYIEQDADYAKMVQQVIDGANFSKTQDQSWQHETRAKQLAGLQDLLGRLQEHSKSV
jgi:hypothetical protein